jgi:hypothetical protein
LKSGWSIIVQAKPLNQGLAKINAGEAQGEERGKIEWSSKPVPTDPNSGLRYARLEVRTGWARTGLLGDVVACLVES